ncbi:MAG: hypothetical protein IPF54_27245 [Draconibacterium sp.]|nr:hypothetical protein [Draconibacterium sp.]
MNSLRSTGYFEIIVNFLFLLFVVNFTLSSLSEFKFLIPGLILFTFSIYSIYFSIKKLVLHYGINAQTPVLQTQLKLENLKLLETRETQLLYVFIPLLSPVFLIVGAKFILNIDLYNYMNWLIAQTAGSVVIAVIIVFILKKFPNKNLEKSIAFLSEIADVNAEN